tara:strand:- start:36 stop:329 length:294 start_codon:yes stop_codon:yes gene_type:complete
MEKNQWSDYERYIVLSDKSFGKLNGTYSAFLNFKKVMDVVREISKSDKSSYLHDGNIYTRRISSTDAKKILLDVSECRWNHNTSEIRIVANQLSLKI